MEQQNNNEPIIITVGRQIGSGGRVIAKMLAEEFHCDFYDKEILNLAAKQSGFSEKFFEQNDEQKGFLKSIFQFHLPFTGGGSTFYDNTFSQESLYKFQSDAIFEAAKKGNCVFVGRTADYILRDCKRKVDIFITANLDQRIQRVCQRHQFDRKTARKYIHDKEEVRATYYNYYTGKTWGHSKSYDLCVNSSLLGIEETERFIVEFICKRLTIDK